MDKKRKTRKAWGGICPLHSSDAFTLVELMIVILLIGILVAIAVPVFISVRAQAERNVCWHDQRSIKYALMRWKVDHEGEDFVTDSCLPGKGEAYIDLKGNVPGDDSRSLAVYFEEGESSPFDCPSNGKGVGQAAGKCDYITDGITVTCLTDNQIGVKADGEAFRSDRPVKVDWNHVHIEKEGEGGKKTPLGDDFDEISSEMIRLVEDFYQEHGRYPRRWGDKAFTELGLDPEDWELPVDHIYYKPSGRKIRVSPEEGYAFKVTDKRGRERYLSSKKNRDLLYDCKKDKWYFKNTSKKNEIDISTLEVVEDKK